MLNAIVDASLRYKVLVIVAFLIVIGLGVQAFRQVPVDAFPDVTPIQVNVYTESPGLAAEDVEKLLTAPIEGALAGLPGNYTEAQLAAFLQTGKRPDGSMARPPMPPYRMSASDAQAVAAYLKSLR